MRIRVAVLLLNGEAEKTQELFEHFLEVLFFERIIGELVEQLADARPGIAG
jgi:hypothetical protein